jgi:Inner membrane protein CreD
MKLRLCPSQRVGTRLAKAGGREAFMTAIRLLAIGFIYLSTAIAWSILGSSLVARTGESDSQLAREVAQLWGGRHEQVAPQAHFVVTRDQDEVTEDKDEHGRVTTRTKRVQVSEIRVLPLLSSRIHVILAVDQRRKGLLWYPTYAVSLAAHYTLRNASRAAQVVTVDFPFPSSDGIYDGFTLSLNGVRAIAGDLSKGAAVTANLAPGEEGAIDVAYRSRGMGVWSYAFGTSGVGLVQDFRLDLETDVAAIDFPPGSISPTSKVRKGNGWALAWTFESLVTGQKIAFEPPNKQNPGPLAARITFFAPVGLLFFVTVMVILGVLSRENMHPMNYFFLAGAFFAFHLLLAYLVDHVDIQAAFLISSATSLFLVGSYLRLVTGMRVTLARACAVQFVFLVLFSYAFFFEGYTGLTVTIGAIVTLFALMQVTGRVDWSDVFARRSAPRV